MAENRVFDLENRDRYDLSMIKLSHAFQHDGREAELEVIRSGQGVQLNTKVLVDHVDTQIWPGMRVEHSGAGYTITQDGTEGDELEVVTGRSKHGLMIQVMMDVEEYKAWVQAQEVLGF